MCTGKRLSPDVLVAPPEVTINPAEQAQYEAELANAAAQPLPDEDEDLNDA